MQKLKANPDKHKAMEVCAGQAGAVAVEGGLWKGNNGWEKGKLWLGLGGIVCWIVRLGLVLATRTNDNSRQGNLVHIFFVVGCCSLPRFITNFLSETETTH